MWLSLINAAIFAAVAAARASYATAGSSSNAAAAPPLPSLGCGTTVREPTGALNHHTMPVEDPLLFNKFRDYYVFVPEGTDNTKPLPVVYSFHGFYSSATHMASADNLINKSRSEAAANRTGFIVVYGQGMADCGKVNCYGDGTWPERSWNTWGQSESPGPRGHTCNQNRARWGRYSCYESCRVRNHDRGPSACFRNTSLDKPGYDHCHASTCANDTLYTERMMSEVEGALCIDKRRQYVTGMSVGGMMAYWLAVHFTHRFAAAAPIAGSALVGFWKEPALDIALMDVHGVLDTTIPANYSNGVKQAGQAAPLRVPGCDDCGFSDDGFYYTPNHNITAGVARVNRCSCAGAGGAAPENSLSASGCPVEAWPTSKDGSDIGKAAAWTCFQSFGSSCSATAPVVRCTWEGAHLLPGRGNYGPSGAGYMIPIAEKNNFFAEVVWEFFAKFAIAEGSEKERRLLLEAGEEER
jgi:poly(3-hydroxybutyrate) depolymerase